MPSSRDASSSDLDRARETSRRLAGAAPRPGAEPAARGLPRFSAEVVRGAAAGGRPAPTPPRGAPSRPAMTPAPMPAVRLPPLPQGGGYDALAGWCQQALSAESVFFLDERGLLVACIGNVPAPTAEAMGARLVFMLEQTDAMKEGGERTKSMSIEFAGSWLSGWRFPMEGVILTVGVVTAKPLGPGAGSIVAKAFASPAR